MNISSESLLVLAKLRPPFARSSFLAFPFTPEGDPNSGITVEVPSGEPAIAAGTGTVEDIYVSLPKFQTTDPSLLTRAVYHVLISHGGLIKTLVGGLSNVAVNKGQTVYRGDRLGDLQGTQLFFAAWIGKKAVNPLTLNAHWIPQNSNVVTGQGGFIRFAPDRIVRDMSHGIGVVLNNGITYFKQLLAPTPYLINVDFNGNGAKTGLAATGYTSNDYWNTYAPVDFLAVASATCYYAGLAYGYWFGFGYGYATSSYYTFNVSPVLCLNDYTGQRSKTILERIAPLFSAASSAASWDQMLGTWIGGYVGPLPYENTFRLRNLPAGNYDLYLYANQGTVPSASTFYASAGTDMPTAQGNNPTGVSQFVEGGNYVKFQLTVPSNGYITFKAVGYLAGMQLQRI